VAALDDSVKTDQLKQHVNRFRLLIALLLCSAVAYWWPDNSSVDPFVLSKTGLRSLVAVTMFCLGLVVEIDELHELRRHPLSVFLGVAVQCTLMPGLALLAVIGLGLKDDLAQGVILVGCVPGAMASNVLTMTARGNVSYSVSLTTVATLISPLTVPLTLAVVSSFAFAASEVRPADLSPLQQALVLLVTVVLPVAGGFLLKQLLPSRTERILSFAPTIASVALIWIIASVVAANRERLSEVAASLVLALLLINLLGYFGGFLAGTWGQLPVAMRRALSLEVGMQNAGLGTYLAALLFGEDSAAQIPTAAYTFGCMLTGTVLATVWGRKSPTKLI
jgi:BASS family bile acid:Na+ symporter